jgi:hypothetical protein
MAAAPQVVAETGAAFFPLRDVEIRALKRARDHFCFGERASLSIASPM